MKISYIHSTFHIIYIQKCVVVNALFMTKNNFNQGYMICYSSLILVQLFYSGIIFVDAKFCYIVMLSDAWMLVVIL